MPWIFAYGTLQHEEAQRSVFGRLLEGEEDALPGYEPSVILHGPIQHANVLHNGRPESRVRGKVFSISDAELAAADEYEQVAGYARIGVTLASGREAWVYVDGSTRR